MSYAKVWFGKPFFTSNFSRPLRMMFFLTLSALSRAHGLGRQHSCISDDRSVRSCREERAMAIYNRKSQQAQICTTYKWSKCQVVKQRKWVILWPLQIGKCYNLYQEWMVLYYYICAFVSYCMCKLETVNVKMVMHLVRKYFKKYIRNAQDVALTTIQLATPA